VRTVTTAFLAASVLVASLIACGGGETTNPPPNTAQTPPASSSNAPGFTNPPSDGGGAPGPTASSQPGPEKPTVKEPEPTPKFDSLPKEKKVEIMSTKVVPNVGKDFKEFDAKRFATFGCATCHGPKKNEDPHKVLPKLTMSNGGFEKMQQKKPEIVKFMSEKVVPDMANALGEKPFDPATKQGFGCAGCHEVK
jgi:cytochrome c553